MPSNLIAMVGPSRLCSAEAHVIGSQWPILVKAFPHIILIVCSNDSIAWIARELGGTGLGLAIVKHLAKSHGGEVFVRSEFGKGTEFTIELPHQNDAPKDE